VRRHFGQEGSGRYDDYKELLGVILSLPSSCYKQECQLTATSFLELGARSLAEMLHLPYCRVRKHCFGQCRQIQDKAHVGLF